MSRNPAAPPGAVIAATSSLLTALPAPRSPAPITRIASLAHQEVGERLLDRLADLAEAGPDGLVLRRNLPRQHLARMIGASREMVSRTMKQLALARAIDVLDDGSIRLNRPPAAPVP